MARFVGVIAASQFAKPNELKRLLLLFEQLALDLSAQSLNLVERRALSVGKNDFDFLRQAGLLTTVEGARAEERGHRPSTNPESELAEGLGLDGISRALRIAAGTVGPAGTIRPNGLREIAQHLRDHHELDAVAVGHENLVSSVDAAATRGDVIRLTLTAMPIPSDTTPWEGIAEFRRDPDSRRKFLRLKTWINGVGRASKPLHELQTEFLEMMFEYEEFLKMHSLRVTKGIMEVLVTTTAEVAEDVAKLKLGKLAKAPFELARNKVALYEAEQKAPGREVAYIIKAQQNFR
jgi:hypothetical protein